MEPRVLDTKCSDLGRRINQAKPQTSRIVTLSNLNDTVDTFFEIVIELLYEEIGFLTARVN